MNVSKMFLTNAECKELFEDKEVYIFGAGTDAEDVQKQVLEYVTIRAYVDNYKAKD